MKLLLILRGAPGCGKTTWVKDNRLIPYTLSFDNLRMLFKSPTQTIYGKESSFRKKDKLVFETMLYLLEERMKDGELTIIDAVNSKEEELNQYNELALKYRYDAYIVDFTEIPIPVTKERNLSRMARKRVPDHIIDKVYKEFETEASPKMKTIKPEQLKQVWINPVDLSQYKKIHHVGDIHGWMKSLETAIAENGELNEDEFYIFLGDYTDKGNENDKVINLLRKIQKQDNVAFCEGNHERWVWNWANNYEDYTEEFETNTKVQLENARIGKKEIRKLYRKLKECFYYSYNGKVILATHGGIATIPQNLAAISAQQMIHGVGLYSDIDQITKTFAETMPDNHFQVFGHRNPEHLPMNVNKRSYLLESGFNDDGIIRWLTLDKDGFHEKEYM